MVTLLDLLPRTSKSVFTFTAGPLPIPALLTFTRTMYAYLLSRDVVASPNHSTSSPATSRSLKRFRPLIDLDGGAHDTSKKKRRLRLNLITSRLSRPYSNPATHIVDRGSSKIAVWAKQNQRGKGVMRKAAILNRIRRANTTPAPAVPGNSSSSIQHNTHSHGTKTATLNLKGTLAHEWNATTPSPTAPTHSAFIFAPLAPDTAPDDEFCEAVGATATPSPNINVDIDIAPPLRQKPDPLLPPPARLPRRAYAPLPPSPLGLSNYDALDLEDDDERQALGCRGGGEAGFYSDFGVLVDMAEEEEGIRDDGALVGAAGVAFEGSGVPRAVLGVSPNFSRAEVE